MSAMEPIRDINVVNDITRRLSMMKTRRGRRMYLMWKVGILTGIRIGDMIKLKVGDLRGRASYTYLPEKQSHKKRAHEITLPLPEELRQVVAARTKGRSDEDWLFPSRVSTGGGFERHITRQQAYDDMQEIRKLCRIRQRVGCHTMRKTFGYHYYQETGDIANLMVWFYHESEATTLIYCGITFDNLKKMVAQNPFRRAEGERLELEDAADV